MKLSFSRRAIPGAVLAACVLIFGTSPSIPADAKPRSARTADDTVWLPLLERPLVYLQASAAIGVTDTTIQVGDTITATVTVTVDNPGECSYSIYDVTLSQSSAEPQVLRFDTPSRLGPPGPNPATFVLTAIAPGTVTLTGRVYGEENCGNGWQWHYVTGSSDTIVAAR